MHKPIISEQLSMNRCIPTKNIHFTGSPQTSRKVIIKERQTRVKSSRTRTVDNEGNLEIVMKLSEIYSNPTQFFGSLVSKASTTNTSTFPNKKLQTASSIKRILLKSALLNQRKKQTQREVQFNVSPVKQNNYKYFPKRETKLKNANPYRFYMLNSKMDLKQKQQRQERQIRNSLPTKLRTTTICSYTTRSNSLHRQSTINHQNNYKSKQALIDPWHHKIQPHEDLVGFC